MSTLRVDNSDCFATFEADRSPPISYRFQREHRLKSALMLIHTGLSPGVLYEESRADRFNGLLLVCIRASPG
jgi:hypothetical protein